jgi:hypothetical protein
MVNSRVWYYKSQLVFTRTFSTSKCRIHETPHGKYKAKTSVWISFFKHDFFITATGTTSSVTHLDSGMDLFYWKVCNSKVCCVSLLKLIFPTKLSDFATNRNELTDCLLIEWMMKTHFKTSFLTSLSYTSSTGSMDESVSIE